MFQCFILVFWWFVFRFFGDLVAHTRHLVSWYFLHNFWVNLAKSNLLCLFCYIGMPGNLKLFALKRANWSKKSCIYFESWTNLVREMLFCRKFRRTLQLLLIKFWKNFLTKGTIVGSQEHKSKKRWRQLLFLKVQKPTQTWVNDKKYVLIFINIFPYGPIFS